MFRRSLIYAALFVGAVIFAWPFVWMIATSAKLERELFDEHPHVLPTAPRPMLRSPYLDERLFADSKGPRMAETISLIESGLPSRSYDWSNHIDSAMLRSQVARGIYMRMLNTLPPETWTKPSAALAELVEQQISPE